MALEKVREKIREKMNYKKKLPARELDIALGLMFSDSEKLTINNVTVHKVGSTHITNTIEGMNALKKFLTDLNNDDKNKSFIIHYASLGTPRHFTNIIIHNKKLLVLDSKRNMRPGATNTILSNKAKDKKGVKLLKDLGIKNLGSLVYANQKLIDESSCGHFVLLTTKKIIDDTLTLDNIMSRYKKKTFIQTCKTQLSYKNFSEVEPFVKKATGEVDIDGEWNSEDDPEFEMDISKPEAVIEIKEKCKTAREEKGLTLSSRLSQLFQLYKELDKDKGKYKAIRKETSTVRQLLSYGMLGNTKSYQTAMREIKTTLIKILGEQYKNGAFSLTPKAKQIIAQILDTHTDHFHSKGTTTSRQQYEEYVAEGKLPSLSLNKKELISPALEEHALDLVKKIPRPKSSH